MGTGGTKSAARDEDWWTQREAPSPDIRGDDLDPAHGSAVARSAGVVRAVAIGVHAILSLVTIGGPRRLVQGASSGMRWGRMAGDRAYDAAPLAEMLEAHGCSVVIPSNPTRAKQRPYDRHLYRERCWLSTCSNASKIPPDRMRFEKLARNFAFLHLVSILLWLR